MAIYTRQFCVVLKQKMLAIIEVVRHTVPNKKQRNDTKMKTITSKRMVFITDYPRQLKQCFEDFPEDTVITNNALKLHYRQAGKIKNQNNNNKR